MNEKLKLAALDASDLEVISAHLQDAVMLIGDMRYDAKQGNIIFLMNRFDWSSAAKDGDGEPYRRRQTALQFDRVQRVRSRKIRIDAKMAVLSLLNITFAQEDAPSGRVVMNFSGGGVMEITVECIEVRLADTGPEWQTGSMPDHENQETADGFTSAEEEIAGKD